MSLGGPGSFDHDVAKRSPRLIRGWTFGRPRGSSRRIFWTQIGLILTVPAVFAAVVLSWVVLNDEPARPIAQLSTDWTSHPGIGSGRTPAFTVSKAGT